jgi:hypothetical protein
MFDGARFFAQAKRLGCLQRIATTRRRQSNRSLVIAQTTKANAMLDAVAYRAGSFR